MKKHLTVVAIVVALFCLALCVGAAGYETGDMDKNGTVNSDDAIYLLRHTLDGDKYPIAQSGDVDGDGAVTSNDAIYLLRHTLSPDAYPLLSTYMSIAVKEDTYVLNKTDSQDKSKENFGNDTEIHLKSNADMLTRFGYVKFDISALKNRTDFTCVELELTLTQRQAESAAPLAAIEIYGASTNWKEGEMTFETMPESFSFVCDKRDIPEGRTTITLPVTDYVRKALAAGKTEIAFSLREATAGKPLHLHFASKENASGAPALSVYFGTKVDDKTYVGAVDDTKEGQVVGLDKIFGIDDVKRKTVTVSEDSYTEAGTSASNNFGSATTLDFKALGSKPNEYYRIIFLKFDISRVEDSFTSAELSLKCVSMENPDESTNVKIYGCAPNAWSEKSLTYNNMPTLDESNYLTTSSVSSTGSFTVDVFSYINKCRNQGMTEVALCLVGDSSKTPRRLTFSSKEGDTAPTLTFGYGGKAFSTSISYSGENPWDVAMSAVNSWLARWPEIKKGGDTGVETVSKISSEYSLTVDACRAGQTDGYNTRYTQYATRNISTLRGYTANTSETAKYDVYGGLMDESLKQKATGYFYTTKIGDRWWTIDPLGYPFYRTAIVTVSMGNSAQKTRFLAKFGSSSGWAQAITDRFWELGFNSVGAWSTVDTLIKAKNPVSQTAIIGLVGSYASSKGLNVSQSGSTDLVGNVLPVFDPEFVTYVDSKVKSTVSKYATSPNVYGWMSDNELPDKTNMLDNSLNFDKTNPKYAYSYATAWTFMFMKLGKSTVSLSDVTDELRREYRAMVYDKLFYEATKALDKYAPNHQFMGARFLAGCYKDEYVLRVAGHYCDVVTLNYYGAWQADPTIMVNLQKWAGKPFVITEWYAKGMDVWEADNRMTNKSGAGWTVRTQSDRGKFYQNFALQLLECKGCVGFDWFKFLDNDPEDLSTDLSNRNANKGIYDNYGNEYTELTSYMQELNTQKYNLIKFFDAR